MDVKEKMVELLGRVQQMGVIYRENQMDERYPTIEQIRNTEVAARLIANGVTVQEWIPVTERFPTSDTIVLVFVRGYVEIGWYDGNHDEWRTGISTLDNCEVTHWMPLPQPPKGE